MDEVRAYYETEGRLGTRRPPRGDRAALRAAFIRLLADEARRSVLDYGAGPGHDGAELAAAGFTPVGLDLAHANAVRAAASGLAVVQGSVTAPPVRPRSFDAGWSMSTLMHLPTGVLGAAAEAMAAALRPGAPLWVGTWGADAEVLLHDEDDAGHRRPFWLRTAETNRSALGRAGLVERVGRWEVGPDRWHYQVFALRVR